MPRLLAIVAAAHAGPTIVVVAVTLALAVAAGLPGERVVIVTAMILAQQLSIGWSNDWLDAERDRDAGRRDKPVARGDAPLRLIAGLAVAAAVLALGLSAALGLAAAAAHAVFLASGWLYNAGLKRTLAATACYAVGFGMLPAIVTLADDPARAPAAWAIVMGALLGTAAHFANVLPDLDDDARHGIRSLPHRMGARPSGAVALVALAVAAALGVVGPLLDGAALGALSIVGAVAGGGMLVAGIVVLARAPASRALFRIIMGAALAAVVSLLGAGAGF
ncbi:UbiA family prenyltransferase [Microcella daejeonensis]|uniref:UbiA family prenyltransferase n=1 Tax=Microcella daejeonensis TaxID=2994971 RepID=A0A9E8ML96_9MICO|nr:UbiA family prenyltransferase [Microcella daejeonensis]WAB81596.1 UbiA family prenyltransferase [Microcella daejeonensis]